MAETDQRVAIDIGGTFTDVVLDGGGEVFATKVLTTHAAPAAGALVGLDEVLKLGGRRPQDITVIPARHDAGDQRAHRAARRHPRPHHHGRPPRRAGNGL